MSYCIPMVTDADDRMLAVMTYNVGFFFAVTGSVLLGELAFGRYTHSGNGGSWQEGGCHE